MPLACWDRQAVNNMPQPICIEEYATSLLSQQPSLPTRLLATPQAALAGAVQMPVSPSSCLPSIWHPP